MKWPSTHDNNERRKLQNCLPSFFNEDARVKIASRARRCFGCGYGSKFGREIKVALAELLQASGTVPQATESSAAPQVTLPSSASASSHWTSVRTAVASRSNSVASQRKFGALSGQRVGKNDGGDDGDPVCTISNVDENELNDFRPFVSAPIVYRTTEARKSELYVVNCEAGRLGTPDVHVSSSRFVGADGFVRFATARGVHMNSRRYMRTASHRSLLSDPVLQVDPEGVDGEIPYSRATLNDPIKGLNPQQRMTLSKATNSKVALTMDSIKRTAWYRDAQRESDVERMRRISCDLFNLRGSLDIAGGEGKPNHLRAKAVGGVVKELMRGGTWRSGYEIKWTID